MKRYQCVFIYSLILLPFSVFASGGDVHHQVEIPWKTVFYQAINLIILAVIIVYFTKAAIVQFFKDRQAQYQQEAQKSEALRKKAHEDLHELKSKILELESTRNEVIESAEKGALAEKEIQLKESQLAAEKIRNDALLTIRIENEKARVSLKQSLMKDAFALAQNQMLLGLTEDKQKSTQEGFIQKIGAIKI